MPMSGVTITVKGKSHIVISDTEGNFTIHADLTDILICSYVGFRTLEIPIENRSQVSIVMEEDATSLRQVTVNAGYYTVKESERTGAIAKITAKEIERQPVTNILGTMQGSMPGISITQETGMPGGGYSISIRGVNSLRSNGNEPLYIIDGVPFATDPISHAQTSLSIPGDGNPLGSISPNDVESIEILKDADATAIYGSRGANGVVLITTKKGKKGKTKFTFNSTYGVGRVTRMMDLMDTQQYLAMRRQAFANDGIEIGDSDYDVNGTWSQSRYTDWQDVFLGGTSERNGWQFSASGGSEQTRFLLSGNYSTETTVFPGDFRYKRGGAHLNLDHTSEDRKFHMVFSGTYSAQSNNIPWSDPTAMARSLTPNAPELYDSAGGLNWENNTWDNPLAQFNGRSNAKTYSLLANATLGYHILENLEIRSAFGFTDLRNNDSRSMPHTIFNPALGRTSANSSRYTNELVRQSWIIEPQLNYKYSFGRSEIDVLLGATFQNQTANRLVLQGTGFANNSLMDDMASANTIRVRNNDELVYRYNAFFGRLNYTYAKKYILNLTGRRDGSSRFGPGNRFASFGAVGAAWLFHREGFLRSWEALSFGKLRASYGTAGNDQIGDYQYLDTYNASGYTYQGIKGLQPARLYNANFGWETNNKLEGAIETGFFNDRVFLTVSWYSNRSSSQLVGLPIAATTGFTVIQANLDATVENRGWEFTLRHTNWQTQHFSWTTSLNLTLPKNRLVSFPGLDTSPYRSDYVIGEPITAKKLFQYKGINPQTGVYEFTDFNGDGMISYEDDRQAVRDFAPEYYGGIQNQVTYKGLQFDFLFQFVRQLNFNEAATQGYAGLQRNQPAAFADSWSQPGSTAAYQLFTTGLNQEAMQASEYYALSDGAVSDASYIRLKNVALSYRLPEGYLRGIGCRLSLAAQNLWTITSYRGADPEFRDAGYLPPLRVISGSIELTF